MHDLPYFLQSAPGDMTQAIQACLDQYKACVLGPGRFEVRGIRMPDNATLCGLGAASRLVLAAQIQEGAAVQLGSYCTVKDLHLVGADTPIELPPVPGKRHGVLFLGDATPENGAQTPPPRHSHLSGLMISAFTGGAITCRGTGYSVKCSLNALNCTLTNCGVGIYVPYFSEYHRFSNVLSTGNRFGCINNGGNNVFVGCGFDENGTGFVIDNRDGRACNNSHGSVVGCTFNHSGENKGVGIHLINAQIGQVFTAGQMWYSQILVENSTNVVFDSFNFGRSVPITAKGPQAVYVNNCRFYSPPKLSAQDGARLVLSHCYAQDGSKIEE